MYKAFRINPYVREVQFGETVRTNKGVDYRYLRCDENGRVVLEDNKGAEHIGSPLNLINVMVREA